MCGKRITRVEGKGSRSGPPAQKTAIRNIVSNLALTDAYIKADRFVNEVKCDFRCPVKTYSLEFFDRSEAESVNSSTGIYEYKLTIRFNVTVKCSKILSVPVKRSN